MGYATAWHGVDQRYFGGRAGQADSSGANLYQQQGTWCVHPDRRHQARSWHNNGGVAAADALIAIGRNVLAAKARQSGIATASPENTRIHPKSIGATTYPSSSEVGEYPVANANKIAEACQQIRAFRDTKGADQSETLWRDGSAWLVIATTASRTATSGAAAILATTWKKRQKNSSTG